MLKKYYMAEIVLKPVLAEIEASDEVEAEEKAKDMILDSVLLKKDDIDFINIDEIETDEDEDLE